MLCVELVWQRMRGAVRGSVSAHLMVHGCVGGALAHTPWHPSSVPCSNEGADILILARTDARQAVSLEEALWRAQVGLGVGMRLQHAVASLRSKGQRPFSSHTSANHHYSSLHIHTHTHTHTQTHAYACGTVCL